MYETINLEVEDQVAVLRLNRPDKLNALSEKLIEELTEVLEALNEDKNVRVIVLTGTGKAFCAGADLAEAANMNTPVSALRWLKKAQKIQLLIEDSPKPVICCINGFAMGGGLEIAIACDIRIASTSAVLALPEINSGLLPGGGGMSKLSSLIGISRTKELVFTGRRVSAEEALSIGLVNEIVESDKLMERVMELAQMLASKPPLSLSLAKETISLNYGADVRTGLKNEAKALSILFSTKDRLEGVQAFLEKRKPVFTGE